MRRKPWMAQRAQKTPWSQIRQEGGLRNGESRPAYLLRKTKIKTLRFLSECETLPKDFNPKAEILYY